MQFILETKRLLIREMDVSDIDDIKEMLQDKEVMYAYEHSFCDVEVNEWISKQLLRYKEDGFGLWVLISKESNEIVGQCGLTKQTVGEETLVEIGYLLKKKYWHQGFAIEAAIACKEYAFDILKLPLVCSIIRDTNMTSRRVAQRNGMKEVGVIDKFYVGIHMPHIVYQMKAEEYNRSL